MSSSEPPESSEPSLILIAEDEPPLRELARDALASQGHPGQAISEGAEASLRAERSEPALLLVDLRMSTLDPWSLVRELKERRLKIPLIVMTAPHNAQAWAEEIEAHGFLAQLCQLQDLVQIVARYVAGEPRPLSEPT